MLSFEMAIIPQRNGDNIKTKHQLCLKLFFLYCTVAEEDGGMVKGARHIYYRKLFAEDGTMKPEKDLKACKLLPTALAVKASHILTITQLQLSAHTIENTFTVSETEIKSFYDWGPV